MVVNCVAFNCRNEYNPIKKIPFHLFPFKRPAILKKWIIAVRRDKWYPSKTSRLCGAHFLESDYQNRPGLLLKLLKPDAVPSVFSFPAHLQKQPNKTRRILKRYAEPETVHSSQLPTTDIDSLAGSSNETETLNVAPKTVQPLQLSTVDIDNLPDCSDSNNQTKTSNVATQTNYLVQLRNESLRRKIKTLEQKLRRRDNKIRKMKAILNEISENTITFEIVD